MENFDAHDFNDLLTRYLEGRETPEERDLLMQLIASGHYDSQLQFVTRMRQQKPQDVYMDPDRYNRVLNSLQQIHAQHQPPQHRTLTPWWMAAAAAVVLAVATAIWLYVKYDAPLPLAQHESIFVFKDKQLVKLPDGSTVILNAGSELTYTSTFGHTTRAVTLKGEGFFDVAHDTQHPFIVTAGTLTTTVLGTAFNISSNHDKTIVTVTRGRVQVADTKGHKELLTPNQQLAVTTTDDTFHKEAIQATAATAWMDGFLLLDNVTVEEAANILSKKYHVKFVVANPAVKSCVIHATFFDNESLDTVLALMGSLLHLEYEKDNGTVLIKGAGC